MQPLDNRDCFQKDTPLWTYLKTELTRGYLLDKDEDKYSAKRDKVYTFLCLPLTLEKVCFEVSDRIEINIYF